MGDGATATGGGTGGESSEDGWLVGEELSKALAEPGAEERYEQRWPFRAGSGGQDWEGRAYVLYVYRIDQGSTVERMLICTLAEHTSLHCSVTRYHQIHPHSC